MAWSIVKFGKHRGKSLPQIIFSDPDWFFWAVEQNVFKGRLGHEAEQLDTMARSLRIPNNDAGTLVVEYWLHAPTNKFGDIKIIPESRAEHRGSSPTFRKRVIDLSVPHRIASYDKLGSNTLISTVKCILFGSGTRVTKKRCETFFDDPENFDFCYLMGV